MGEGGPGGCKRRRALALESDPGATGDVMSTGARGPRVSTICRSKAPQAYDLRYRMNPRQHTMHRGSPSECRKRTSGVILWPRPAQRNAPHRTVTVGCINTSHTIPSSSLNTHYI